VHITIFTDGSARGNPGRGGYGVVLKSGVHYKEISEGFQLTTNNRMELLAVIVGLESLKLEQLSVQVYTDSKYVCEAIEKKWLQNWLRTDFKGKKNKDLWLRYHQIAKKHTVKFHWIKGHAGHPMNERCDELATQAADGKNLKTDFVYEELFKAEKMNTINKNPSF
jgi:ribonuclease HI